MLINGSKEVGSSKEDLQNTKTLKKTQKKPLNLV